MRRSPGEPWSFDDFADHTWRKGMLFEPGAGFAYSNPGYLLLKRILERVADRSYADLVATRICRPLDLERRFVSWRRPSYGLGVMADPESPVGPVFGHNGGGPGYDASAFHAPRLAAGGVTACALCAVEEAFLAENLVLDAFALPFV